MTTQTKIALVGSGPAALFALEKLRQNPNTTIHVYEQWPFPFGLVRYGVSPDHQGVKNIQRNLARHLAADNVRLLGGITINKHISVSELRRHYHATLLGIGAQIDTTLNIPGENLPQVHGSSRLAGWYNTHPDHIRPPPLAPKVALIGQGNVAIDAARVLLLDHGDFNGSDLGQQPTRQLRPQPVQEVAMLGRRGPAEAKFTTPELREICRLKGVRVEFEGADMESVKQRLDSLDEAQFPTSAEFRRVRGNLQAILQSLEEPNSGERLLRFVFGARPLEFVGAGDALAGVRCARTAPDNGRWRDTDEQFTEPCGFAVTCIGYRAAPLEGVPYDDGRGIYPNENGRIADGLWSVGWCKRGPSGAIANNRKESHAVAEALLAEVGGGDLPPIDDLLAARDIRPVGWEQWLAIEKAEERRASEDRVREKFTSAAAALEVLK
ncbi:MAG: hypothetical protein MPJ53_03160 [Alphaproteobacteria bacterium]|nr:hypothetical protein [Alphaproteobacteria bacterium]